MISIEDFRTRNTAYILDMASVSLDIRQIKIVKKGNKYISCDDGYAYIPHRSKDNCLIRKAGKTLLFKTKDEAINEKGMLLKN